MKEEANVDEVARLKPDFMGFIFHEKSLRNAIGIDPAILACLPEDVTPVAVTVNKAEDYILQLAATYGFRTFQLHGNETPEFCEMLRRYGLTVWKALPADDNLTDNVARYACKTDLLLIDTPTPAGGGSGKKFDWKRLQTITPSVKFMLSGGLSPEDGPLIMQLSLPGLTGVDINSRFETVPGHKNPALLTQFFNQLR